MKKVNFLAALVFGLFLVTNLNAQINIPKSIGDVDASKIEIPDGEATQQILKALDPGKTFTSPDKYTKLLSGNKDLLSKVTDVMGGSGTEEDKVAKVDQLKGEHKDFVEQLLGEGKATEYYRLIKKNLEPLSQKLKLAKLLL